MLWGRRNTANNTGVYSECLSHPGFALLVVWVLSLPTVPTL